LPVCAQESPAVRTWTSEEAWDFLGGYQYGDDMGPLLLIENEVERSLGASGTRRAMASRLVEYLDDTCTPACRQFVCMQLRLVGGEAEIPALAKILQNPTESENARLALEAIPCDEAIEPLREALRSFQGTSLVGVIHSLARRQDSGSLPAIVALTESEDEIVRDAAVYALGKFGQAGLDALDAVRFPVEDPLAGQAALNVADDLVRAGNVDAARVIWEKYADPSAQRGCRRAALTGLLNTADTDPSGTEKSRLVIEWFTGTDPMKVQVAAAHLPELSEEDSAIIAARQSELSQVGKIAFLEMTAGKDGTSSTDSLFAHLKSDDPILQATAARLLARRGVSDAIVELIPLLASDDVSVVTAARDALCTFSPE
ncbi:MAG: HEAT repeat domain-containing protein, partial [Planctomycetia bacterium]|nr:HEAT repeat domain-containing protein [Planctomycetia bacterium]